MLSRLWGWIVAAGAVLVAALLFVMGQRDKAREKAKQARVSAATHEANREADNAARKAQQAARSESNAKQREDNARPKGERPTGTLRHR